MLKKLPDLRSDLAAEEFVATADLSDYDLSSFSPARFVLPSAAGDAVTLPPELLRRVEAEAERSGVSREEFVRRAVEDALPDLAA